MVLISPDTKQLCRYINLGAKPFVPGVSETSTPELKVRDPNGTVGAKSCAPGTFPSTTDTEMTVLEKALERQDWRRGTPPMVPGVAGLAMGSEELFRFFGKQKQRMAVL